MSGWGILKAKNKKVFSLIRTMLSKKVMGGSGTIEPGQYTYNWVPKKCTNKEKNFQYA